MARCAIVGELSRFTAHAVMAVVVVFCYLQSFLLSECCMLLEGFGMTLIYLGNQFVDAAMFFRRDARPCASFYATCFLGLPPLGALMTGELSRHIPTSHALAIMPWSSSSAFLFSTPARHLD
ncbi:hypothetical protein [Acidicapsa acidisoli]|uniref:hypothetical protein n=1 Tax=Acidicapsa acidisoli TaxID=1615681 RepID=UPI0021E04168|nr:hypothetical protein [Acidicapsa acidisoli]